MTTFMLVVGGIVTAFLLLNAVLSFIEHRDLWASWFRLLVAAYSGLVSLLVASWFQ